MSEYDRLKSQKDALVQRSHRDGDSCFCVCCMKADQVWELRRNLANAERSLEFLCAAQKVSAADLLKRVDARRSPHNGDDKQ